MIRLNDYLKSEFGEKVYKISLTSGCTCPNRDGSKSFGGCYFCSASGSGDFAETGDIDEQIIKAKERISQKTDARKFIAYFQSFSNTYGDIDKLNALYSYTISKPEICVLSIASRADCIDDKVLEMLKDLNAIKPVWVELGLQTINEDIAKKMNMQYSVDDFDRAYKKLKEIGIKVIVHVIFGFPEDGRRGAISTIKYLANIKPKIDGIKISVLQVLKNTKLGEEYLKSPFPLPTLEEYASLLKEALEILPPDTVVHRLTGDPPRKLLIAPLWTIDKKKNLNYINKVLDGK